MGVGVGVGVGIGVDVGSGVGVGLGVGVGAGVAVGLGVGVAVGTGTGVLVGICATASATPAVTVAPISGVMLGMGVDVGVGAGAAVGDGEGPEQAVSNKSSRMVRGTDKRNMGPPCRREKVGALVTETTTQENHHKGARGPCEFQSGVCLLEPDGVSVTGRL